MSKAILVMDMPVRCADCPLCASLAGDQPFCFRTYINVSDDEYYKKKPNWCPLRELPQKQEYSFDGSIWTHERIGWNACIDKILKEGAK